MAKIQVGRCTCCNKYDDDLVDGICSSCEIEMKDDMDYDLEYEKFKLEQEEEEEHLRWQEEMQQQQAADYWQDYYMGDLG